MMKMHVYVADGTYLGESQEELRPGNQLVKSGKFVEVISFQKGSSRDAGDIAIVKQIR